MTAPAPGLDVAELKFDRRRILAVRLTVEGLGVIALEPKQWDVILTALERAEEVAGQGCEFCDAMVDDLGEERDGGREPHAHWWACGRCWNESAGETSTVIGHLSDLRDAALAELEGLRAALKHWHHPVAPSGRPCRCVSCEGLAAYCAAREAGEVERG